MNIAATTKISALIKANPAAVDAIASINRHFEKLRNPVLRKILASRVTIADAARIGGCEVELFYEKLAPLGFQVVRDVPSRLQKTNEKENRPEKLSNLPAEQLHTLDVREDIAAGNDPFKKIMEAIETLKPYNVLQIINTFEPTPLLAILKKKGFDSYVEEKSADLVYSYFWASDEKPVVKDEQEVAIADPFDEVLLQFAGNMKKVDVRHLEMPQPMITILQALEQLPAGMALFVNHKRVPQYLLPQIEARGFAVAIREEGPGAVNLLIYK